MIQLLTGLAVAYGTILVIMITFQRSFIYFPDRATPTPAASGLPEIRPVTLKTADGLSLRAWYQPAEGEKPTVVLFHGNAGHFGHRAFKVRPLLAGGYGVLLFSYRGYGGNPGSPSEQGLYRDGRAALDFLVSENVQPERTVLYGESLGSAVAVELAAGTAFAGVILESPFTSMADVARFHYALFVPTKRLVRDKFDSLGKIGRLKAPLLVLHGERDEVVPQAHGQALLEAAPSPKRGRWFAGAGHNDLYEFGAAEAVSEFLGTLGQ